MKCPNLVLSSISRSGPFRQVPGPSISLPAYNLDGHSSKQVWYETVGDETIIVNDIEDSMDSEGFKLSKHNFSLLVHVYQRHISLLHILALLTIFLQIMEL